MGFTAEIFQTDDIDAPIRSSDAQYANIPRNTPDIPNVDVYAAAVAIAFRSCRERLRPASDYTRMAHEVVRHPTGLVGRGVRQGDPESMLELAMRYGSGCAVEDRLDRAIQLLELILARDREAQTPTPGRPASARMPEQILQRTHSAAALAFYSKYSSKRIASTSLGYHDPDLLRAAAEADRVVAAGLPSRAALLVAKHLVALSKQYGVLPGPWADMRFGVFRNLWEAYAAHEQLGSTT